jgi:phosphoribosylformimino-5-aminoimidazole carboxamide ribotide isomerase
LGLIIYPAIDLRNGKVVRLRQGDPTTQTVFSDDPVATALSWGTVGAKWLHVVNLDGALGRGYTTDLDRHQVGTPIGVSLNLQALANIRGATALPIQYGGGIRSIDQAAAALELGATRVILGTIALESPKILAAVLERFGAERVVIALDARDGKVSTHGWQSVSSIDVLAAASRVQSLGAIRVLYTDVSRDGMLSGVNVAATAELARRSGLRVIASGGVAGVADIHALAAYSGQGIEGVVVGRALYTGAVDLAAAIAAGSE